MTFFHFFGVAFNLLVFVKEEKLHVNSTSWILKVFFEIARRLSEIKDVLSS